MAQHTSSRRAERAQRMASRALPEVDLTEVVHLTSTTAFPPCDDSNGGNAPQSGRPVLCISGSVLEEISRQIGERSAEHGGVLGGSRKDGVVRHFYFDDSALRTGATYSPDHVTLNRLFKETWNPAGINLLGFVHSHPAGCRRPSGGDLVYAHNILKAVPDLERLLLPIVMTEPDTGRFQLLPFGIVRDGDDVRVVEMELEVLQERPQPAAVEQEGTEAAAPVPVVLAPTTAPAVTEPELRPEESDIGLEVAAALFVAGVAVGFAYCEWLLRRPV